MKSSKPGAEISGANSNKGDKDLLFFMATPVFLRRSNTFNIYNLKNQDGDGQIWSNHSMIGCVYCIL